MIRQLCNKYGGEKEPRTASLKESPVRSEVIRLVDKASDGDFEAFGDLYGIYLEPIYRYVYYHVNNRMMAEDITEEVFVKAWKAIGSCRGRGKTFSSWIYRIAHNHIINTLRNNNKSIAMETEGLIALSDRRQKTGKRIDGYELSEMLDELPLNQKHVIVLKFIEGMSNSEISKILNKSEVAVRILQMRGLAALRQCITAGGGVNGA